MASGSRSEARELAAQTAVRLLQHGDDDSNRGWLNQARHREFAFKWRFNRALRSLVGSPMAMRAAAAGARLAPSILERVVRVAGDVSL